MIVSIYSYRQSITKKLISDASLVVEEENHTR
jgi:hypothetical protein